MEKAWIASSCFAFLILSGCFNNGFIGFVSWFYGFVILIAVLIWIMLLLASGSRLNKKTVMARLAVFLLFLGVAVFPLVTVLGIWLISYLDENLE